MIISRNVKTCGKDDVIEGAEVGKPNDHPFIKVTNELTKSVRIQFYKTIDLVENLRKPKMAW